MKGDGWMMDDGLGWTRLDWMDFLKGGVFECWSGVEWGGVKEWSGLMD